MLEALSRSFHHRNFRLFFAGQFISLIGTWMQSVALSWLVYQLTGSSMYLGLIGFINNFPVFVLGLWGGYLADRWNKRALLVATQVSFMLQALALAFLTLGGVVTFWAVAALALLAGAITAVDMPTRQSFVVEMVGREDLHNAIALNSSMFNSARILGPALAGLLVAAIGEGYCFLANGLSYLAVIAGLLLMRLPPAPRKVPSAPMIAHLVEGLTYAWRDRPMRAILLGMVVLNIFGASYMVLMPVMADAVLGQGAQGMGFIMGATGLGSVVAALVLALRREGKGLDRWRVLSGLGFSLTLVLFGCSRTYWLSLALAPAIGFCLILSFAAANTELQLRSPDVMRGRIMSLYAITLVGMAPFGSLLAGAVADLFSAPLAIGLTGALCAISIGILTITHA